MKRTIEAVNIVPDMNLANIKIELPSICPHCNISFSDIPKSAFYIQTETIGGESIFLYTIFFCPHCESCFYITYDVIDTYDDFQGIIYDTFPYTESTTAFSDEIKQLSPDFIKIYNQAEKAESCNLSEICGIGYRKAIEFLVKDFAIFKNRSDEEAIKSMPLSKCINTYINDENLKNLLEKSVWIGNDETHYVRKHSDRDYKDIKRFTSAIVYFINMVLVATDAATILPA